MVHSESEETTKFTFDAFLDQCCAGSPRLWQDGENPPDYRLAFGDLTFAVEVTALMSKVELGQSALPMRVIADELYQLGADAESIVREDGVLHGTFTVHFPKPIPELSRQRRSVITRLREAIAHLSEAPQGREQEFWRVDGRSFVATKVSEAGAELLLGGPTYSAWRSDACIVLTHLLADRVRAKVECLQATPGPAILLLDERYPLADEEMYAECACSLSEIEYFHTIFVSRRGTSGILLKSGFPECSGVWDKLGVRRQ